MRNSSKEPTSSKIFSTLGRHRCVSELHTERAAVVPADQATCLQKFCAGKVMSGSTVHKDFTLLPAILPSRNSSSFFAINASSGNAKLLSVTVCSPT
jgi:hypothetical protein